MRVVIVGAGEVGFSVAEELASSHDVVVVDIDQAYIDEIVTSVDVLGIAGDGTTASTLDEAEIAEADILIASTDDDHANIVSALTAKSLADVFTIARVNESDLLESWKNDPQTFGVDHMVCTNLETARVITDLIGLPAARDVKSFSRGAVKMAEFDIAADSPIAGQTVADADQYDGLTFVAVYRDDTIEIVTGDTVLHAGDSVIVIGAPTRVRECAGKIAGASGATADESIVVIGGSAVGYHVARQLEQQGRVPRLIEPDANRARVLAEQLPNTMVMENDPLDIDFLTRERIGQADTVVVTLDSDEKTLLCTLLVDRLGVDHVVGLTSNPAYSPLFETVGVDAAVTPREVAAEEIVRFTRSEATENVAFIEHDAAEVLELRVDTDSPLADQPLHEAMGDLPDDVVIGAITRGTSVVTPRGDTVVQPGDHVLVFVDAAVRDEVTDRLC